jgi:hypothetical protein
VNRRYRVMITGSREWENREAIRAELIAVYREHSTALLIHGDARGADTLAKQSWESMGGDTKAYPAKWRAGGRYNAAAGRVRNGLMVATMPDLVLAFFQDGAENKGTSDAVKQAWVAGIPVRPVGAVPAWVWKRIAQTRVEKNDA